MPHSYTRPLVDAAIADLGHIHPADADARARIDALIEALASAATEGDAECALVDAWVELGTIDTHCPPA